MFTYTLELAEKLRTGIVMAFKPINSKPGRKGKGFTLEIYNDLLDRQIAGIKMELRSKRKRGQALTKTAEVIGLRAQLKQCEYLKQEVNGWYDYDAIT
jgi:hypothetical protein